MAQLRVPPGGSNTPFGGVGLRRGDIARTDIALTRAMDRGSRIVAPPEEVAPPVGEAEGTGGLTFGGAAAVAVVYAPAAVGGFTLAGAATSELVPKFVVFGDQTSGTGAFPMSSDRAIVDRFNLSTGGTIVSGNAYAATTSTSGANWKFIILSDSSGLPGNVLWTSAAQAVPAGGGWLTFTGGTPPTLSAGDYWLGIVADNFQGNVGEDDPGGAAPDVQMADGTYSYATPPTAWPGSSASYSAVGLNVYATVDTASTQTFTVTPAGGIAFTGAATIERVDVWEATGAGGFVLAGAGGLARTIVAAAPAGGFVLAGAGGIARAFAAPQASGSIAFTGAATVLQSVSYSYTGAGGFVLAGAATLAVTRVANPAGGFTWSGAATIERVDVWEATGAGGFVLAGAAPFTRTFARDPAGGLALTGAASIARTAVAPAPAGGVVFSGTAGRARTTVAPAPAGGVVLSGTAPAQYQPAGGTVGEATGAGGFVLSGAAGTLLQPVAQESPGGGHRRRARVPSFVYVDRRAAVHEHVPGGGLRFRGAAQVLFARRQFSIPMAVLAAV